MRCRVVSIDLGRHSLTLSFSLSRVMTTVRSVKLTGYRIPTPMWYCGPMF